MGREEINIVGPLVYPAMLSKVGEYLRAKVPLALHMKDSLSYSDCFRGRDAVDTLCYIIKTTDRNLALLLGRALDAQKFFHDVTYNHRLRDSAHELYKFQVHRNITPMGGETPDPSIAADDTGLPNGVFTLLTDCYSPTCTRDRLCYSIACPRRLEQQTRLLNQAHPRMHRSGSRTSLGEKQLKEQLWSSSVPREVVNSVSHKEMKRQEIIFETILTERQFVADLDLVQRIFVEPLRQSNVIDPATIETFIQEVFLNIKQLHSINVRLLRKLLARQCENPIVGQIGDVFMEIVNSLDVYVEYGARQVYAKSIIDQERAINPAFDQFLTDCERLPECRKLPVQSFLARPTTRMGRYPLLLKSILEASPEGHSDRVILPRVIATLKDILHKINKEAGRAENFLKLNQLQSQLVFHPGEQVDLGLLSPSRQLLREGTLILRRNGNEIEVHVFLFDHVLLITKKKKSGVFKVYKRPIPLETFHMVEGLGRRGSGIFSSSVSHKPNPSISSIGHTSVGIKQLASQASRNNAVGTGMEQAVRGYPFTITHLGRAGTSYTLYASNQADRRSWRDAIEKQKLAVTSSKCVFEIKTIMDNAFPNSNKVNSSVSLKEKLIIGTDNGLYVGPVVPTFDVDMSKQFHRVIDLEKIYQVDVLPEYGMLNLLAEKTLYTYPLETLEHISAEDANAASRKGRKVASHVSFFKQGVCDSRTLVSAVRITTLNSTVKVFEPVEAANAKKRGKFGKFLLGESDNLKLFKEFYVPTESSSIDFLRSKICVGCTKGFEIVDLHSLDTQGLLDPSDENLDFVSRRTDLRPISIFRIRDGDFLLCYNEIAFYVDRLGRKSHGDWFINWTGYPVGFSLILPYVIAYEPSFIEVRHVDTGELVQIIPTSNMRPLNTNPDFLHCVDSVGDFQHIFKLRKVQKSPEPGSV
ncbi:CNH domain-containing protein [Phlyctochytrium arcticum]|nr:CNH domain-containing protein [Phlyctochytrium arcticum]